MSYAQVSRRKVDVASKPLEVMTVHLLNQARASKFNSINLVQ